MEDSMAVDVVLWFILAGMVALIFCSSVFTAPRKKQASLHDDTLDRTFDRAA